jgi:hypothetical protein
LWISLWKKNEKKWKKNKVFHYELPFIIVFYDYIEKIRFLEKSSFSLLPTIKNIPKKKYLFLEIWIYLYGYDCDLGIPTLVLFENQVYMTKCILFFKDTK